MTSCSTGQPFHFGGLCRLSILVITTKWFISVRVKSGGEKQRPPRTVLLRCEDAAVVIEGYASTSSSAKGVTVAGERRSAPCRGFPHALRR